MDDVNENEPIETIEEVDNSAGSKESSSCSDKHNSSFENLSDDGHDIGKISLEFIDADPVKYSEYPSTYHTFSAKERLMLIFVEYFRRQFIATYPNRKRLVLAIPNECDIQKFVSTTIRPTSFLFCELIDCWNGPARFVADFIKYEPLEDQLQLVSQVNEEKKRKENKNNISNFIREDFIKFIFI